MPASQDLITTGVDSLITILQEKGKLSLDDAAKLLNVKSETLQNWVDFLVEEEIVGIEYKFVTPYIFLQTGKNLAPVDTKEEFFAKAKQRGIDENKIKALWKQYVTEHISSIKELFYKKAVQRRLPAEQIDSLWQKYEQTLHEGMII